MPIKAYVGQPRSGKSYEVVSNVILNGLRDGRRIVSNIAGLDYEAMQKLLVNEGVPAEKIGTLVHVTEEQVKQPSFWMTDKDNESGFKSFLQPGDLLCLDEIWRFWKKRGDIDPRALNFFRMHGHFPHPETGFICEIALISQIVTDINENIRGVIQETYLMTKATAVGSDKTYSITIYAGGNTNKRNQIRQILRTYNKAYFPLYKSHSQQTGAAAVEKNIDNRGNILKGAFFKMLLPVVLILAFPSGYFLYKFFNPDQKKNTEQNQTYQAPGQEQGEAKPQSIVSDNWRLVGWFESPEGDKIAILDDGNKKYRFLINPPYLTTRGWQLNVKLPEGNYATTYSGKTQEQPRMLPK